MTISDPTSPLEGSVHAPHRVALPTPHWIARLATLSAPSRVHDRLDGWGRHNRHGRTTPPMVALYILGLTVSRWPTEVRAVR